MTTNTKNGKIYIGKYQTTNINDSYMGSGHGIKHAIKKYDKNNFKKEILFVFENQEDMDRKEKELITEEFVLRKDTYNASIGGEGGPHFAGNTHTQESIDKMLQTRTERGYTGSKHSEETRKKISESMKGNKIQRLGENYQKKQKRKLDKLILVRV